MVPVITKSYSLEDGCILREQLQRIDNAVYVCMKCTTCTFPALIKSMRALPYSSISK